MLVSPPIENLEVHIRLAGCWVQLNNMADVGYKICVTAELQHDTEL
jgi:hypothetical protein